MKLGLIARADNSGLGIQTHEFYRHMHPAKTMVVDISKHNGNRQYPERYNAEDSVFIKGFPNANDINMFLEGLDVVFIAEAAYNPYLYTRAGELGVKTAVQYNYEFFDWFDGSTPMPDMFIAPSMWHYADVDAFVKYHNLHQQPNTQHKYLHCPVNRAQLPRRHINQARIFLHTAGKSAAHDRNGTMTVIEAGKYLKTDAQIIIHFQGEQGLAHQATQSISDYVAKLASENVSNITIQQNEFDNYADVYAQGDVLLLPRRYGGNCLPLNEALSVGMPAIMTDISPNNSFLPHDWLVPASIKNQFRPRTTVNIYGADPQALAAKIDEFYLLDQFQMEVQSHVANQIAGSISWEAMKPKYEKALEKLCTL